MVVTDPRPVVVSFVQVEIPAFAINFQVRLQLRPQSVDDLFANVEDLLEGFAADFGDGVAKVDSDGTEAKLSQARSQVLHDLQDWTEQLKQVSSWKSKADRLAVQLSETRAAHLKEATLLRQQLHLKAQAESRGDEFVPTTEVHFGTRERPDEEVEIATELQKDFAAKLREVEAEHTGRICALNEQIKTARMMVTLKDKLLEKRREEQDLPQPEDRVSTEEEAVPGEGGEGPRDLLLRCLQQKFGSLEAALNSLSSAYDVQGGLGLSDFSRLLAEVGFAGDPGQAFAALRADVVHLADVLSDERAKSRATTDAGLTMSASDDSDGETGEERQTPDAYEDRPAEGRDTVRADRNEGRCSPNPIRPPRRAAVPSRPCPANARRKLSTSTSNVGKKRHSAVAATEDKGVDTGPYESCFPASSWASQACQTALSGEILDKASQYLDKEAESHWRTLLNPMEKPDAASDSEALEEWVHSEESHESPTSQRRGFRALAARRLSEGMEASESTRAAPSSSVGRGSCKELSGIVEYPDAPSSPSKDSKDSHARELRHLVEAAEELDARLPELRAQAERLLGEAGHGEFRGMQERALVARLGKLMRSGAGKDAPVTASVATQAGPPVAHLAEPTLPQTPKAQASSHVAHLAEPAMPQSPKAPARAQAAAAHHVQPGPPAPSGGPKACESVAEILSRHGVQEAAWRQEAPPSPASTGPPEKGTTLEVPPSRLGPEQRGILEGATPSRANPPHTRGPKGGEIGQAVTVGQLPLLRLGTPTAPARRHSAESTMEPSDSCPVASSSFTREGGTARERRHSGGSPGKPWGDKSQILGATHPRRAPRTAEGRPSSHAPMTLSSLLLAEQEELPAPPLDTSDDDMRPTRPVTENGRQARSRRSNGSGRPTLSVDADAWTQDPLQPLSPHPPVTPAPPQQKRPVAAAKAESQDLPPMTSKVARGSVILSETADVVQAMRADQYFERPSVHAPTKLSRVRRKQLGGSAGAGTAVSVPRTNAVDA